jgi:cytochrome b subunit of formate dehydrogenase
MGAELSKACLLSADLTTYSIGGGMKILFWIIGIIFLIGLLVVTGVLNLVF